MQILLLQFVMQQVFPPIALLKATDAIVKKLADTMLQDDTYETHLDCNDKNHRSY